MSVAGPWIVGGVIGAGVLILIQGLLQIREAKASLQWPIVIGRITTSELWGGHSQSQRASAHIVYEYTVSGVVYTGNCIHVSGAGEASNAEGTVMDYPVNLEVEVSVDPTNPRNAVLVPGTRHMGDYLGLPIFGLLTMAAPLLIWYWVSSGH